MNEITVKNVREFVDAFKYAKRPLTIWYSDHMTDDQAQQAIKLIEEECGICFMNPRKPDGYKL